MTRRTTPMRGQGTLEGMPERPILADLEEQLAFARMARPEFVGLDEADYTDITDVMIRAAAPANFRSSLIHTPGDISTPKNKATGPNSVDYSSPDGQVIVALNAPEAKIIMRTKNPETLAAAGYRTTLGSIVVKDEIENPRERAERSGLHTVEGIQEKMQSYIDKSLKPGLDTLKKTREKIDHPGFRRQRGDNSRIDLARIRTEFIDNALTVISHQRTWTDQEFDLARRATDYRLFFDRKANQHLSNWQDMINFLIEYQSQRLSVFFDRNYKAKHWLDRN